MKKILIILAALNIGAISAFSQNVATGDFALVPENLNPTIHVGDTAIVKLTITNYGQVSLRAGSVSVGISAPSIARFVGIVPGTSSPTWTIQELGEEATANQLVLVNTQGSLGPAPEDPTSETIVYAQLVGVSIGTNAFTGNIGFNLYNGLDSFASYVVQGNSQTGNDFNTTAITITSPLPLNFTDINAAWKNEDGIVKWTVAQEVKNNYFEVERSFNGKDFENVGEVKSIGDHQDKHAYTFTDLNAKSKTTDKVFYRIKQVDLNGKSTLSSVTSLSVDATNASAYIFPNPVKGNRFAFVYEDLNAKDMDLNIQIIDMQGRALLQAKKAITKGKNQIELSTEALAAGAYYLNYFNADNNVKGTIRFAKD